MLERINIKISETTAERAAGATARRGTSPRARAVVILPRGEAIRNFVYTGALDELTRRADVSLLSVIPNPEIKALLEGGANAVHELQDRREHRLVGFQREILDMAHGRWLWSEAAKERWRLRDREAHTAVLRAKRWAKKLICYPFANRTGLELLSRLESASGRWLGAGRDYEQLYKALKPALVFNSSHVHAPLATAAVRAAQGLGIPTATFIFSWDNLTSQGRIMPPYDFYLVWNEDLRKQLLSIYHQIRPEQVFVTGTPQFDFHFRPEFYWTRKHFCEQVGADPARPIVLYTTGMANHMPGEPLIVERLARMLREMTDLGPPQLLVRVYPKDRTGRFAEVARRFPDVLVPVIPWEPNWLTPLVEDAYLLTNMLRHAAVGINVASTTSLELCMLDKPVINVGFNPPHVERQEVDYSRYYQFDHYRPIVESGAVEVAYSEAELYGQLASALAHPERLALQRKSLVRKFFGNNLDGWSSTRVASVLETLASRFHDAS